MQPKVFPEPSNDKNESDTRYKFFCLPFLKTLKEGQEDLEGRVGNLDKIIGTLSPSIDLLNTNFNRFMNGDDKNPPVAVRLDRIERAIDSLADQFHTVDPANRLSSLEHTVAELLARKQLSSSFKTKVWTSVLAGIVTTTFLALGGLILSALFFYVQHALQGAL